MSMSSKKMLNLEGQELCKTRTQGPLQVMDSAPCSTSDCQQTREDGGTEFNFLTGWRLHVITGGIAFGVFLINFELVVTSTALVDITSSLNEFGRSSWIVTSYLCTYIAGLVIWAKLSDLFGRKWTSIWSHIIFVIFSGGCGASQTMVQLIVCRAFQGIGASGIYAVGITMMYELAPTHRYPFLASLTLTMVAFSFTIGPIIGGAIAEHTTWRWVFLVNVPPAAIAGATILLLVPAEFPYQGMTVKRPKKTISNLDIPGAILLVAALILLITGLEQGASVLDWTRADVLGPLIASGPAWLFFLASQWRSSQPKSRAEPLFPWRFLHSRPMIGMLLNCIFTGGVNVACIFQLPQRYQTAAGLSQIQSGIRLIPFSVSGAFGTVFCAMISKGKRLPPLIPSIVGGILQIIGLIFLSRSPQDNPAWVGLMGLQVLVGLGYGACIGMETLLCPFIADRQDLAAATGAIVQFRFLGSAIAIAVLNAVGNGWVRDRLLEGGLVTAEQIATFFKSAEYITALPPALQHAVRIEFLLGFNLEMSILLGFAVASVFTNFIMWQRPNIRVP